jgi:hypothetical protein
MFKAFVGIADCTGLESFIPEGAVPIEWLSSAANGCRGRKAVCYYAVLSDEAAEAIRGELDASRRMDALCLLEGLAVELLPVH